MSDTEAIQHLPKCAELDLHNTSPMVHAVLMLLRNGEEPKKVLDSVLCQYATEVKGYQDLLKKHLIGG